MNNDGKTNTTTTVTPAPSATTPATADRMNTAVNTRDRDSAEKTPIDQNENQKDSDITASFRRKVVAEMVDSMLEVAGK